MPTDYTHIPVSQGGSQFHSPVSYMPLDGMPNGMQTSNANMQFPIYSSAYGVQGGVPNGYLPELDGQGVLGHHGVNNFGIEQESMEQWPGNGY